MDQSPWGNNSDKVMALFAGLAFVIALGHVLWDIFIRPGKEEKSEEQARDEQNRWRTGLETKITDDRIMWEDQLDRRQEARQKKWREDEEQRLTQWRQEDLARQEESFKPKLEVTLSPGFSLMNPLTGVSETRLFTDAVNTGSIPVFFSNWGGFKVDDEDKWIEWPQAAHPSYCGTDFDFSKPLAVGQRCRTYMNLSKIREGLESAGRSGIVNVRGYYTDQRGTKHFSKPYSVKV